MLSTLIEPPYHNRDGSTGATEHSAIFLLASAQSKIGSYALEIGTLYGDRTNAIARALPNHVVFTVDLPPNEKPKLTTDPADEKYFYKDATFAPDVAPRVQRLLVDSANLTLSIGTELGFAFIDGAHSYDYTMSDFKKCVHYASDGAMIMLHDFEGWAGVTRCVHELVELLPDWGWKRLAGTSLVWCRVHEETRSRIV